MRGVEKMMDTRPDKAWHGKNKKAYFDSNNTPITYSLGFSVELIGLLKLAMGRMDDVNAISKST